MYPIIFRNLVFRVGFQWTIRTIAFINIGIFVLGFLTLRTRLPPPKVLPKPLDFKIFVSIKYCVYVMATTIFFLGIYTPLGFISVAGASIGMDPSFAFYLVAIATGSSVFGRILSGVLALRFGPLNVMVVFMFLATICTYIWPSVTNHSGYILKTVLYGCVITSARLTVHDSDPDAYRFASGPFLSLFATTTSQLGEPQDFGRVWVFKLRSWLWGALGGPPISGAIQGLHGFSFHEVGVYAGSETIGAISIFIMYFLLTHTDWLVQLLNPLEKLVVLNAVVQETMRLGMPFSGLPRLVPAQGMKIDGQFVPGGTEVNVPIWTYHVNEEVFRDAKTFDPGRWIKNGAFLQTPMLMTFGAGAFNCVGSKLAYVQLRLITAMLLLNLNFTTAADFDAVKFWDGVRNRRATAFSQPFWIRADPRKAVSE
ncbi:cytochrome P450 [Mycena vulgaris]|nr:cytochrome P450 [Mycena vulgaris]